MESSITILDDFEVAMKVKIQPKRFLLFPEKANGGDVLINVEHIKSFYYDDDLIRIFSPKNFYDFRWGISDRHKMITYLSGLFLIKSRPTYWQAFLRSLPPLEIMGPDGKYIKNISDIKTDPSMLDVLTVDYLNESNLWIKENILLGAEDIKSLIQQMAFKVI